MLPAPTPTPSSEPPPFWFVAPDGFYALPLADTAEERAAAAERFVRGLYVEGDESLWGPAAPYYAGLSELMEAQGISYAAVGLYATGEEGAGRGVAQAVFTVAVAPTDQAQGDTETVAQGVLAVLRSDPHNDVRWLDLPCGPAVSSVTLTRYTLAPEVTATGEPEELLTGQMQVHVPFPTGPHTAVFTLFTAFTDYWREFSDLMGELLRSVSFVEPTLVALDGEDGQDGDVAYLPGETGVSGPAG
ncbi:hypothetical protein OHB37_20440 [Streptomyces albidoflavus]|uniref:hypothetical protein n=1 Tax=Streptomyces TaxID=1883 RepID=UPI001BE5BFB3|nr:MULTISPECIES: hypothetical protein [unclassified Streptomyces]MBT2880926.1 hypothetical protein [Streptomyces sp. McG6]MBT2886622.1 hypothetical protein [Streptomyces sp. McG5]MBT2893049.1 hypothetical protein [Streptomyces sp. McG2]WSB16385.1 hypothetical protein OHB37_20440 [Streptomyces albidoflavus]